MKYGVCGNPTIAAVAAEAGYDFCEWTVGALLKPLEPHDDFLAAVEEARATPLPFPVLNIFIKNLKIVGPEKNAAKLKEYAAATFERAQEAGVEIIVFGSGGARRIPEGLDAQAAHDDLFSFSSMIAPIAADHGVTVALEPLCKAQCNVLNTVAECAALVREVAHPSFRLLVDAFHMLTDGDPFEDIVPNADLLAHVHIATGENRLAPGAEPCDFAPFFSALTKGGYDGRVSIEAKLTKPATELPRALSLMQKYCGNA